MEGQEKVINTASSVAQQKGRVQDLGRGSCSKNMSQSPGSVGPLGTTDISKLPSMEEAPLAEKASLPSVGACGSTCQPGNLEREQDQLSSPALLEGGAGVQGLPKDMSAGSSSKQLVLGETTTFGLTKTQKRNRRRKLQSAKFKASPSNAPGTSGIGAKRPLSSGSTPSPGLKVLQKKPREDLQPGSFAVAVKTYIKMIVVRENFPTNKLSAENSVLIQRAILEQMDSVPLDSLSLKIYGTELWKGALIVQCGDTATVEWLRNCLDGDRKVLGGTALKVISASELSKPCKVAFRTRNTFTTDPRILLKRLQRLNEGLITEHWKVLDVSSEPNSSRWIFEVEQSDVDTIRGLNLRAFSGLDSGIFKILYDPRCKKVKVDEGKPPGDYPSEVTTSGVPSSSEFEDLYLPSGSEARSCSIPGLTLLSGGDLLGNREAGNDQFGRSPPSTRQPGYVPYQSPWTGRYGL